MLIFISFTPDNKSHELRTKDDTLRQLRNFRQTHAKLLLIRTYRWRSSRCVRDKATTRCRHTTQTREYDSYLSIDFVTVSDQHLRACPLQVPDAPCLRASSTHFAAHSHLADDPPATSNNILSTIPEQGSVLADC